MSRERAEEMLREHWLSLDLDPDKMATLDTLGENERATWLRRAEEEVTHVIIARAVGRSGSNSQVKMGFRKEPSERDRAAAQRMATAAYRESFDREPDRIGVGVLPYVADLDEPDEMGTPDE